MKYNSSSFPFKQEDGGYSKTSYQAKLDENKDDKKDNDDDNIPDWQKDMKPLQKKLFESGKKLLNKIRNK